MKNLRQIGFFSLVAIALAGCGSVAAATLDSPTSAPSASSSATAIANPSSSPSASGSPTFASIPGVPESLLQRNDMSMTTADPSDATVSEATAQSTAEDFEQVVHFEPATAISDAELMGETLADITYTGENPPVDAPTLDWIFVYYSAIPFEPPSCEPVSGEADPCGSHYLIVAIDAQTGYADINQTGIIPGS